MSIASDPRRSVENMDQNLLLEFIVVFMVMIVMILIIGIMGGYRFMLSVTNL